MSKNIKKSSLFIPFRPLIKNIYRAKNNRFKAKTYLKYCFQQYQKTPILNKFSTRFDYFCRKKFIQFLTYKKLKSKKIRALFKQNVSFYLTGEHENDFIKFIKKINRTKQTKKQVYNILKESISSQNIFPSKKILPHLDHDIHWSRSLQYLSTQSKNNKKIFKKEFNQLKRRFYRNINRDNIIKAQTNKNQLINFYRENKLFINDKFAQKSFIGMADKFLATKLYHEGQKTLQQIESVFTSSSREEKEELLFRKLWFYINRLKFDEAFTFISKNNLLQNFEGHSSRINFWLAYILKKVNLGKKSEKLFLSIIKKNPLNYYSILAYKILPAKKTKKTRFVNSTYDYEDLIASGGLRLSKKSQSYLKRIILWSNIQNTSFIEKEIEGLFTLPKKELFKKDKRYRSLSSIQFDNILTYQTSKVLNSSKQYLSAFKVIYKGLSEEKILLTKEILKFLFPRSYFKKITRLKKNLDPYFILSLMRQESAFNPQAKSSAGARGLMQLMPQTAKRFVKRRRRKKLRPHHLEKPHLNIQIGVKYLRKLIKKFDGNLIYTLAAYNAGENRVVRWKKNRFTHLDPLFIIESIPYLETRKYVKLIYRNIFFYNLIYGKKPSPKTPFKESFKISSLQ